MSVSSEWIRSHSGWCSQSGSGSWGCYKGMTIVVRVMIGNFASFELPPTTFCFTLTLTIDSSYLCLSYLISFSFGVSSSLPLWAALSSLDSHYLYHYSFVVIYLVIPLSFGTLSPCFPLLYLSIFIESTISKFKPFVIMLHLLIKVFVNLVNWFQILAAFQFQPCS